MPRSPTRFFGIFALAALVVATAAAFAADGRLYPSGPPNGVAYLRFVNLASVEVTIVSPAAKITIPTDDAHRIGEFDPVTPGVTLTGSVQLGEATKPINVTLQQNEFVTVAVTGSVDALAVTLLRETPSDFNALKSSLGLFNLDQGCGSAQLVAGDQHLVVVSDVAPGAVGRRMVNPVDVGLAVSCGDPAQSVPVKLGGLVAGDRYSVFVIANGSGRQAVGQRDEQAPFRP
ncbi:MAG TPA: alginate O-acetyltransferase AlgF [Stellaceae bacterium]|nr:alginate O-acetyltransferase AlgF [Stellaceae bacterium]